MTHTKEMPPQGSNPVFHSAIFHLIISVLSVEQAKRSFMPMIE